MNATKTGRSAPAHTATPWNVGEMGSGTLAIYGRSRKAPLCQFGEGIDEARTEPKNAQADAAFIVKACNTHDELVATLRELLEHSDHIPVISAFGGDNTVKGIRKAGKFLGARDRARAILAKVEGQ